MTAAANRTLSEHLRSVDDYPDIRGPIVKWCHEAADTIESLQAEVEKLREVEGFCQQVVHPKGVSDDLGIDTVAAEHVLEIIRGSS